MAQPATSEWRGEPVLLLLRSVQGTGGEQKEGQSTEQRIGTGEGSSRTTVLSIEVYNPGGWERECSR